MVHTTTRHVLLTATLGAALALHGCKGKGSDAQKERVPITDETPGHPPSGLCEGEAGLVAGEPDKACEVMATVNGVPITLMEVEFALMGGHGTKVTPAMKEQALERLIEGELAYQRALELGLDKDPKYRLAVRTQLLRLGTLRRNEMLRHILQREVAASVQVGPEDAKKYFDEHAALVRSEFHLLAIRFKDRASAEKAVADLRGGASFEELAKSLAAQGAPHEGGEAGSAPWDLGVVAWKKLPQAWSDAVADLEPGGISDVVADPRTGIRVLKLVERRENPEVKLEEVKNAIMIRLHDQRLEETKKRYFEELEKKAAVVRTKRP